MKNKYEFFFKILTLSYILIPIVIFFLGWLRSIYSFPATLIIIHSAYVYTKKDGTPISFSTLKINWTKTGLVALTAFFWVYCSGIGGYVNQDWDHNYRNAVFYDLQVLKWPIFYDFPLNFHIKSLAGKHSSLNYYFTFWLPAACVGKIFGQQVASVFLFFWSYLGILISFYYLTLFFNFKYSLACIGLFIFWSNYDIISYLVVRNFLNAINFFSGASYFHFYTSFTNDLYNPYNQAIPTWVLTLYVLNGNKKIQLFPVVLLLAYSPFTFIGLSLAHGLLYLFSTYQSNKKISDYIQEIIQAIWRPDIFGVLVILLSFGLFYQAHSATVQNIAFWNLYLTSDLKQNTFVIISYLIAFFLEVGIYLSVTFFLAKQTYQTYKVWFWITFCVLSIMPLWVVGKYSDLSMRSSIPFLVILLIITLASLFELYETRAWNFKLYAVLFLLFISFTSPIYDVIRSLSFTDSPVIKNGIGSMGSPKPDESNDPENLLSSIDNFYSHNPQHFLFYKYLAKQ